jgi:hypothetical protein
MSDTVFKRRRSAGGSAALDPGPSLFLGRFRRKPRYCLIALTTAHTTMRTTAFEPPGVRVLDVVDVEGFYFGLGALMLLRELDEIAFEGRDVFAVFDGVDDGGTISIERGDRAQSGFEFKGSTVTLLAIANPLIYAYCRRQNLGVALPSASIICKSPTSALADVAAAPWGVDWFSAIHSAGVDLANRANEMTHPGVKRRPGYVPFQLSHGEINVGDRLGEFDALTRDFGFA